MQDNLLDEVTFLFPFVYLKFWTIVRLKLCYDQYWIFWNRFLGCEPCWGTCSNTWKIWWILLRASKRYINHGMLIHFSIIRMASFYQFTLVCDIFFYPTCKLLLFAAMNWGFHLQSQVLKTWNNYSIHSTASVWFIRINFHKMLFFLD